MPWTGDHIKWLNETLQKQQTPCGLPVVTFNFQYSLQDHETMSKWARHLRNHYCLDEKIDELCTPMKLSRRDYLLTIKFPAKKAIHKSEKAGPATRAGDFAEILISDYLATKLNFWVPRIRYEFKVNPNTSEHGSDVIGMRFSPNGEDKDELMVCEVKATFSGSKVVNRLQDAVDHSDKDQRRLAESLNAIRQRLQWQGYRDESTRIGRFQNPEDKPYVMKFCAAAVVTEKVFDAVTMAQTNTTKHAKRDHLRLMVIYGAAMMDLVHYVYDRAADEA